MPRFDGKDWNRFFEVLQDGIELSSSELKAELRQAGLDVNRVEREVAGILEENRNLQRAPWLERARRAQRDFEKLSEEFRTAAEIVEAIASGKLGHRVLRQAQVFFRNGDFRRASESDLRTFLDDCELLDLIERKKKEETGKR